MIKFLTAIQMANLVLKKIDDKLKKIDENVATHTSPGNGMMKVSLLLLNFFSTDEYN